VFDYAEKFYPKEIDLSATLHVKHTHPLGWVGSHFRVEGFPYDTQTSDAANSESATLQQTREQSDDEGLDVDGEIDTIAEAVEVIRASRILGDDDWTEDFTEDFLDAELLVLEERGEAYLDSLYAPTHDQVYKEEQEGWNRILGVK